MSSSHGISNGLQSQLSKVVILPCCNPFALFGICGTAPQEHRSPWMYHVEMIPAWSETVPPSTTTPGARDSSELGKVAGTGLAEIWYMTCFDENPNAGFERGNITRHEEVQTVWRKWHAEDRPNSHLAYSLASLIGDLSKQNIAFRSMYGQKLLFPFGRKDICNHLNERVFGFWTCWHCYSFWTHSDHAGFWRLCRCQCSVPK